MNLNTIAEVKRPARDEITQWRDGYAWLAGGTWLFSEPQVAIDTLDRPRPARLAAAQASAAGLEIAATCRIAELYRFDGPAGLDRRAAVPRVLQRAPGSFKIWNAATVGGNICMSLPAGPMISLTAALEGVCTLWPRDARAARGAGGRLRHRQPPQRAAPGELLRSIHLPAAALRSAPPSARPRSPTRPLGRAADRHAATAAATTSC